VRLTALRRAAAEFLHEPGQGEPQEQWFGWRPMTWDDLPIIGRAPGFANLLVATGHGMLGVSMAPITGLLVRDLVLGHPTVLDVSPLSPARFL
jgi:D-amino-acid dehydrogenase